MMIHDADTHRFSTGVRLLISATLAIAVGLGPGPSPALAAAGDTVADRVLGQTTFTGSTCNNPGVTASSLCFPEGVAVDNRGRLYLADQNNHRILSWPNAASFSNGQ